MDILSLTRISEPRGNLTFLQHPQQVPFEIKRVFWTYNVPSGETRGGHAYHIQEEIIIALSGSFDVVITDKFGDQERIHLNRSYEGLHLIAKTWRHLENFSTNCVSLHLSSSVFNREDYIRDFDDFKALI
jgi:hypothetical protein